MLDNCSSRERPDPVRRFLRSAGCNSPHTFQRGATRGSTARTPGSPWVRWTRTTRALGDHVQRDSGTLGGADRGNPQREDKPFMPIPDVERGQKLVLVVSLLIRDELSVYRDRRLIMAGVPNLPDPCVFQLPFC